MSYPKNINIKSIVNSQFAVAAQGAHHFEYKEGYYAVNTNFERCIEYNSTAPLDNVLVMNHYFSKSKEDFAKKIIRGSMKRKNWTDYEYVNSCAVEQFTYALHLGEELRQRVQINAVQYLREVLAPSTASCAYMGDIAESCLGAARQFLKKYVIVTNNYPLQGPN